MSHESGGDELVNNALDVFPAGKTLLVQNSGMIPWMQSDFCVCGQNKKHCDTCAKVSCFELEQKDRGAARLLAVPHSIDCSCTLYGPAKNLIEDDLICTLSYGNFDMIVNHTIMPEVKDAEAFYAANANRSLENAVTELDTRENGKKYYITYHEHLAEGVKIAKNADAIKNIAVLYDELSEKYGG